MTPPESHWHWLTLIGCYWRLPRSPVLRYWEAWMAAEKTASGDCLVSCSHKRQTQYTHKEGNRDPCRRFYCIFRVMVLECRATRRCVNLCVLLVLPVSQCRHVFIGVWTFCTGIKWITPIHFIVPLLSLLPFMFPFHIILLFSEKLRTEKRQMKGVDGLWLSFYSNLDLNYTKNVVGACLNF